MLLPTSFTLYIENVENQQQYISFLCNTPVAQATKGQFVDLNDLEKLEFVDSALESMADALSQRKPFENLWCLLRKSDNRYSSSNR